MHPSQGFLMVELFNREETEIIEGEVVEIQIDRPATGTVGCSASSEHRPNPPVKGDWHV